MSVLIDYGNGIYRSYVSRHVKSGKVVASGEVVTLQMVLALGMQSVKIFQRIYVWPTLQSTEAQNDHIPSPEV